MAIRHDFADRETLAKDLADAVAHDLATGIAQRGHASLALSGGSTPTLFFTCLATHTDVDWQKVTVTLVDERWVDESSDRSNAKLVKQNLLQQEAAKAQFVPLYTGSETPDSAAVKAACDLQKSVPHPFDAVVLGMGNDGHTASFFPGADALEQALSSTGPVVAISAPAAGEPRVTLTLPHLLATNGLYLHIEGADKAKTLAQAEEPSGSILELPVRAVLQQQATELHIYSCA